MKNNIGEKKKFRLVFAGGIDWSVEFLELLFKEGFSVIGVLAPLDSKKDRGQQVSFHPLKLEAKKKNIPVLTPASLKDPEFISEFKKWKADVVVVVAYGKIFPPEILEIPSKGFVNFHPSLLPALRGPSPIPSAILEDLSETGVSIMKLGAGMDDGPVFDTQKVNITKYETATTLTQKLLLVGKTMLVKVLEQYLLDNLKPISQKKQGISYSKIIRKEEGKINWKKDTAESIERKMRAFEGTIKVFSTLSKNNNVRRVNFLKSEGVVKVSTREKMKIGEYRLYQKNKENFILIKTKKDFLLISKIQVEGKNPVSPEEFLRGYEGGRFGN